MANFAMVEIGYSSAWRSLEFRQTEFHKDAYLDLRVSGTIPGIRFAYCDLSGLQIASLPIGKVAIDFEEIRKWNETKKWYQSRRAKIMDEQTLRGQPVKLVDVYRHLERYFYEHSDFSLASQFHIGQMVAIRKQKYYSFTGAVVNRLYQLTSNYGNSLIRPLISLLVTWCVFPIVLLLLGMPVNKTINGTEVPITTTWSFRPPTDMDNMKTAVSEFASAFGSNLSLSTIDRKHELSPPSDSLQKILLILETAINVILGSTLILAVKRKFSPKKPTGN
jgi:hypothetical protein